MVTSNLPLPGEMYLDHSGHFVECADQATSSLRNLGFTVTPYSAQVQPDPGSGESRLTGTGNVCVMLPEGYLEFLVFTADTPIGREFKESLNRRAGLHLSAFSVADATLCHAQLQAAGHPMRPLVNFQREVSTGQSTEVARFTVARLVAGSMPEGRVQVLTHYNESAMWQPRWTTHENRAQSLRGLVVSAPVVEEAALRFQNFLGVTPVVKGAGVTLQLDRGCIDILPEAATEALIGDAVEPGRAAFAGVRVGVSDLSALRERVGMASISGEDEVVVPFDSALGKGAWIFEQA